MAQASLSDTVADFWAGATATGVVAYDTYPPATYSCTWRFRSATGHFDISATETGTSYRCTIPASTTEQVDPGDLYFVAYVTDTAGTISVADKGKIIVRPNPRTQSHAEIVLAAINARIEGRATDDQLTIAIADVQLLHMTPAELLTWQRYYSGRVRSEMSNMNAAVGLGRGNKVVTSFVRDA